MRRARALWKVFCASIRFEEALERHRKRRLTAEEAGKLLGMSGRHFRRLMVRYDEDGLEGLRDQRLGKPSPRRAPEAELARMQQLYQELLRRFLDEAFSRTAAETARLQARLHRDPARAAGWVWRRRPGAAVRTARSASASRCRACCCSRTVRPIAGYRRSIAISISSPRSTTPPERSIRPFSWRRKARLRASSDWARRSRRRACFARSTPIGDHTTSTRPRPAARSTRPSSPRSAARCSSSGSRTSRPTRRKRAAAWSGSSEPYRVGCRPNCAWPRSPRSRPPTATSRSALSQTTTLASRLPRPSRDRPSSPCRPAARGRPLHPRGPPGRTRQLRPIEALVLADPAAAPPSPLRQGRARARISRWSPRHLRRPELPCPIRPHRRTDQCLTGRAGRRRSSASSPAASRKSSRPFCHPRRSRASWKRLRGCGTGLR